MATNPIGKGTKNITVNMPEELKAALEILAHKSDMSLGHYIRAVLEEAKRQQIRFKTKIERVD